MPRTYMDQYAYEGPENELPQREKNKYALRIGKFLFEFSEIEAELNKAIARVINDRTDQVGYVILAPLRYGAKVELFQKLYGLYIEALPKSTRQTKREMKRLVGSLRGLGKFRNKVAHANWASLDPRGFVRVRIESDDGGVELVRRKITVEDLEGEAEKARNLMPSFFAFYDAE